MQNEISILGFEIRALQGTGWSLWLIAIVAFVILLMALCRITTRPRNIESTFRSTFSLTDDEMMEIIIQHYMRKHDCGRQDAMRQLLREVDPELAQA